MVNCLPDLVVKRLQPAMASVINFNNEMSKQISAILIDRKYAKAGKSSATVFATLLDSGLPAKELSPTRLQHEAISLVGAGIETTKRALSVASFHILQNPAILARLREELITAIPDPETPPPLEVYEKLPYLSASIEEALRLSYGIAQRMPRISDTQSITYQSYVLPPRSVISMSNFSVSHDEELFPDSFTFQPERWPNAPKAPDGKYLSRYMVSFGKGTRSCLGMTLAYAEMYIAIATVFRRCEFELFRTNRDAVDCYRDMYVPHPKPGTLGVRARVK